MDEQENIDQPFNPLPPVALGLADFGQVWSFEGNEAEVEAMQAAPDLPTGLAEALSKQVFQSAADIRQFFTQKVGAPFISWFNASIAGQGFWKAKSIAGANVDAHFDKFWDSYAAGGATLTEFIAYMCIFINERDGDLVSKSELFGMKGHPGIAYLFDSFVITNASGRSFRKASYNRAPNKLAGNLFRDPDFNAAHGTLPMGAALQGNQDPVWNGQSYPQATTAITGNPGVTGYILETDFFKFRGRGLIQTTWRSNYAEIVKTIQAYERAHPTIQAFRDKWKPIAPDKVCTISSNSDWDTLFQDTNNEVVCMAIRLHAKAAGYLPLSASSAGLNGGGRGSLQFFGSAIGGSPAYGDTVQGRAAQIAMALRL